LYSKNSTSTFSASGCRPQGKTSLSPSTLHSTLHHQPMLRLGLDKADRVVGLSNQCECWVATSRKTRSL